MSTVKEKCAAALSDQLAPLNLSVTQLAAKRQLSQQEKWAIRATYQLSPVLYCPGVIAGVLDWRLERIQTILQNK